MGCAVATGLATLAVTAFAAALCDNPIASRAFGDETGNVIGMITAVYGGAIAVAVVALNLSMANMSYAAVAGAFAYLIMVIACLVACNVDPAEVDGGTDGF